MRAFGVKSLRIILTLWGVATVLFVLFRLLGDPAEALSAQRTDAATQENLRQELGLNQPLLVQYGQYLHQLSPIGFTDSGFGPKAPSLGSAYRNGDSVIGLYFSRLPATLLLTICALMMAGLLGISMGTWAGLTKRVAVDKTLTLLSVLGVSAPSFFVGVLLLWLFAFEWYAFTGLPAGGYVWQPALFRAGHSFDWRYLVLPALTLGIRPMAVLFQLTRNSVRQVRHEDYIRTARAKGLSAQRIVSRHLLKNALNPVLTAFSGWFAALLAGTFFIEFIFNWPGIGQLTIEALLASDYPVVMGSAMMTAALFIVVNLLMDLIYKLLDPRVRLS